MNYLLNLRIGKGLLLLALVCWLLQPGTSAQAQDDTGDGVGFVEITPELREAVERGLAYLADQQAEDGSWGGDRYGRNAGITALACMAFMSDGHLPGRGSYGEQVERGLNFILANATPSGLIAADTSHGPMYGHGFATLFLAEIYGMTHDPRVREALIKAVKLIVDSQNDEGGWRYHPVPLDADLSVTICQIMALRAARNAGISVPRETIDRAIDYTRACQNHNDGGFRYMLNSGGSAFPRSAAGVATLYYAGIYEDEAIDRGLAYVERSGQHATSPSVGHYYYGHYYAAQAMYLAGGEYWANWFPRIRQQFLRNQRPDGSWVSNHGNEYGTAMSLIILQIPNRLLPIFQK